MPRPISNLDEYRLQIELWLASGSTRDQIAELLDETFDVEVSVRTVSRRLHGWGIRDRTRRDKSEDVDRRLRARMTELFADSTMKDVKALEILNEEGFALSIWQLSNLRREMDLLKRVPIESQPANHAEILRQRKRLRRMKQRRLKKGLPWPDPDVPVDVSVSEVTEASRTDPGPDSDPPEVIQSPTPPTTFTPDEEFVTVRASYLRELERKVAVLTAQAEQRQQAPAHMERPTRPSNARQIPGLLSGVTFQPSATTMPTQYPSHYPQLDPSLVYPGFPS